MNTLKYKVLFKNSFLVFLYALGLYLLLTLPALVFPPMYLLSASIVLTFGWIAGVLFMILFAFLVRVRTSWRMRQLLLYLLVAVCVLPAFQSVELAGRWDNIWNAGLLLLFPACAVTAGWLSIRFSRRRIHECFLLFHTSSEIDQSIRKPYSHV